MHVCVVGAGAAGLAALRHCLASSDVLSCVAYEQTDSLGGTWVYTDQTGIDSNGLPVHTSMYQNLVTNIPKEVMEYPDFPFKQSKRSFLKHDEVLDYLETYADHYKVREHIKYHNKVTHVSPTSNNRWIVKALDLKTKQETMNEFDAVLICNGHYSEPNIPNITGMDTFKGFKIHSHFYRKASTYQNKKVLMIGAGSSAIDISMHLTKKASKVILFHRASSIPWLNKLKDITIKSGTLQLTEDGARFNDVDFEPLDAVIYGTGYHYSFPFLSESCDIRVVKNRVQSLYKHFINIEHPTMAIIGLTFGVLPFLLFDYQIRMFLNSLTGKIQLPDKEEMMRDVERDMEARLAKGYPEKYAHKLGVDFQADYFAALARVGGLEPIPPVKMKLYNETSMKMVRHLSYELLDRENFKASTVIE